MDVEHPRSAAESTLPGSSLQQLLQGRDLTPEDLQILRRRFVQAALPTWERYYPMCDQARKAIASTRAWLRSEIPTQHLAALWGRWAAFQAADHAISRFLGGGVDYVVRASGDAAFTAVWAADDRDSAGMSLEIAASTAARAVWGDVWAAQHLVDGIPAWGTAWTADVFRVDDLWISAPNRTLLSLGESAWRAATAAAHDIAAGVSGSRAATVGWTAAWTFAWNRVCAVEGAAMAAAGTAAMAGAARAIARSVAGAAGDVANVIAANAREHMLQQFLLLAQEMVKQKRIHA
jgi:hypothetical protein